MLEVNDPYTLPEPKINFASLETYSLNKDLNFDLQFDFLIYQPSEDLFSFNEENERLTDEDEMIRDSMFKNICNNQGLKEPPTVIYNFNTKSKQTNKDKFFKSNEKNEDHADENSDKRESKDCRNQNIKEENEKNGEIEENAENVENVENAENVQNIENTENVQNAGIPENIQNTENVQNVQNSQNAENIQNVQNVHNIQNTVEEKPKEILYIEIKREENIIENENEENSLIENSEDILNDERGRENNIAGNNHRKTIMFKVTNVKTNLFKNYYIFSPLTSLEENSDEIKYQLLIRDKIKEVKKAFKENKVGSIVYSFKEDIFFNSKKKNFVVDIKKRKYDQDNILKKIKAGFSKVTIILLNEDLKRANSEKYFSFLPQCFVKDNTKRGNGKILNMTFEELLKKNFYDESKENNENEINKNLGKKRKRNKNEITNSNKEIQKKRDMDKILKNIDVLGYLENNKKIINKIKFDKIKKMTYSDLFEEYLGSHEFEKSVLELLKEDDVTERYIIDYIVKAFRYSDFLYKSKEKSTI